eukprot:TRINITY_DN2146_c0_g1_i1.p1 TRINITY_DN2146_c0_g1~~TRINITY_DN2146_c0_g1_i1.p1  ORF type:complete len:1151 (-),score=166.89 TRINITY_DN2146_c0_g1_i1:125-3577(-)
MVKYRFDLYVRYTVEVELASPPKTVEALRQVAKRDFVSILKEDIPDLDMYGCAVPPGGTTLQPALPLRSDADLTQYISTLPSGYPIIEVHIPEMPNGTFGGHYSAGHYRNVVEQHTSLIQNLQGQITHLRKEGHGIQQGFSLLQQVATAKEDLIEEIVLKFGAGVGPILTAIVASPQEQWTVQQCLRVLALCGGQPQTIQEIFQTGGATMIVDAMNRFVDDPITQRYAQHLIATAASNREYAAELHRSGAVPAIIRNLRHFKGDSQVQQYGCWALAELAITPEHRDAIAKAGGMEALISAMHHFPRDVYCNRYALAALEHLATVQDYAKQIIAMDGVTAILTALATHGNDPMVVSTGLSTLAELSRHDECKEQLRNAGVVPVILSSMKAFANNPSVQESGLRCLALLATNNVKNQTAICKAAGIPMVIRAIGQALESRETGEATLALIAQGLNLLACLCVSSEGRLQIAHSKGVELALQAINTFHNCAAIQEHGFRIFAGIAGQPELISGLLSLGVVDAIINSMRHSQHEVSIQANGSYALGMLACSDEVKSSIADAGGIEVLVSAMYFHPRGAHVCEQACAALSILTELDQNKVRFGTVVNGSGDRQQNATQTITSSVRNMSTFSKTIKQVLKLIAVVGLSEDVKSLFLQGNMLECIYMSLQGNVQDSSVLYYGNKAFVTLAYPVPPEQCGSFCIDYVDLVIGTMNSFFDDARIQEVGCEVLSVLGRLEILQDPIIGKGGIRVICAALKNFEADTGIQRKGCRAFANIGEFVPGRTAIRTEDGISRIVASMKYHAVHPEVGEQGCAAFANLALDEMNRKEIAKCDGVLAVLAGLRSHQNHPGIQAYGLGALGNLAVEEDNCNVILQAGAIEMIIFAMKTWPGEARVQHFACLACSNIAHADQSKIAIGRLGGNKMIIGGMQRHKDHAGVQQQACGALANLSINGQNMSEIAQLGGIEVVVTSIQCHPHHPGVQENACFALSKFLTIPNETYRQRMKAAGAAEALSVVQQNGPAFDVRICINVLLRRLNEACSGPPQQQQQQQQSGRCAGGFGGDGGYSTSANSSRGLPHYDTGGGSGGNWGSQQQPGYRGGANGNAWVSEMQGGGGGADWGQQSNNWSQGQGQGLRPNAYGSPQAPGSFSNRGGGNWGR